MVASQSWWKKLFEHLGSALILATALSVVGYIAADSYAAFFKIQEVDAFKIAQKTFYTTAALAIMGALLLLASGH